MERSKKHDESRRNFLAGIAGWVRGRK